MNGLDFLLILIIGLILAGAVCFIVREKKKGVRCIGCPSAGSLGCCNCKNDNSDCNDG